MTEHNNEAASSVVFTARGVQQGIWRLLPVSIFVIPFGIAFGASAVEQGLTALQAMTMSITVFAGASQFAALDMWRHPLPYVSLMLIVLAVNARHIILGAVLSPWINQLPRFKRFMALLFLTDANFADSYGRLKSGVSDVGIVLGGGLVLWVFWIIGTFFGAVMGSAMGSLDNYGIDVVMPAFFTALVVGEIKSRIELPPLVISSIVAVATLTFLPVGWNIIVAALAGGLTGVLLHDK